MTPMEHKVIEQLREQGYEVFQNGWPDLLVRRDGEFRAIEVKAKTDHLRRAQVAMHDALADFGMDVEVVTLDRLGRIQPRPNCPQEGKRIPRMTTPRSNIVKLRLTDLEKQDWQEAAGGARQLSAWVRSICNAACENLRMDGTSLIHNAIALTASPEHPTSVPNEKPKVVSDAIEREVAEQGLAGSGRAEQLREKVAQCPRWMHHRPGVYCGSCKQVVKK